MPTPVPYEEALRLIKSGAHMQRQDDPRVMKRITNTAGQQLLITQTPTQAASGAFTVYGTGLTPAQLQADLLGVDWVQVGPTDPPE